MSAGWRIRIEKRPGYWAGFLTLGNGREVLVTEGMFRWDTWINCRLHRIRLRRKADRAG